MIWTPLESAFHSAWLTAKIEPDRAVACGLSRPHLEVVTNRNSVTLVFLGWVFRSRHPLLLHPLTPYYHRPRVSPCHHRTRLALPPPSLLSSSPSPSASPLADSSLSSLFTVDLVPSPSLSESSPSPWLLPSCRYRHSRRRVVFVVLAIMLTAHLLCPRPRP